VIILISLQDHKAAVFGDQAVDQVIGEKGWTDICDRLVNGLKSGEPCDALCESIKILGDQLSTPLPRKQDDINELPNEPSYSDEH
jgi:putative membrane protein